MGAIAAPIFGSKPAAGGVNKLLTPWNDSLNTETQSANQSLNLGAAGATENKGEEIVQDQLTALQQLLAQNPRTQQFDQLQSGRRSFATTLGQYGQGQFLPSASDISYSNQAAQNLFAGQRNALQQGFEDQTVQSNRMAASLGRDTNDPILQTQLRRGFMQQNAQLSADQGAFAQQLAMQMPQQRLGYQEQSLGVLESILNSEDALTQRANQNRMALLGLGQSIMNQQQQFRLGAAGKSSTGRSTGTAFDTLAGGVALGSKLGTMGA